jgi:hypothetical protein
MELLFESRQEILLRRGRLNAIQGKAEIEAEPVLMPDNEIDGAGAACYGSVLQEGGHFRMWYQAAPRGHGWDRDFSHVAHAESGDGIHWVKSPPPGRSSGENLTKLGLHSPSVSRTPFGYFATGCVKRSLGSHPAAESPGYYSARSGDGWNWELEPSGPRLPGGDVITSVWDDRFHHAEIACKYLRYRGGIMRRAVFNTQSTGGGWTQPRLALLPGAADDAAAIAAGYRSADFYGVTLLPAGATGLAGFAWMFYHLPPYSNSGAAIFGAGALVPFYREAAGEPWVLSSSRTPFLEHPEGLASGRFFYAASSPIVVGDEHWLYCTVFGAGHGHLLDSERKRSPAALDFMKGRAVSAIHLARWKRDRIFGFRAETDAELVLLLGAVPEGAVLRLNLRTSPGGHVSVALGRADGEFVPGFSRMPAENLEGFDFADCPPMEGDHTSMEVAWKSGPALPASTAGKPLIATVRLFMAECFAYEIVHP